jgi:hypothetical protein
MTCFGVFVRRKLQSYFTVLFEMRFVLLCVLLFVLVECIPPRQIVPFRNEGKVVRPAAPIIGFLKPSFKRPANQLQRPTNQLHRPTFNAPVNVSPNHATIGMIGYVPKKPIAWGNCVPSNQPPTENVKRTCRDKETSAVVDQGWSRYYFAWDL